MDQAKQTDTKTWDEPAAKERLPCRPAGTGSRSPHWLECLWLAGRNLWAHPSCLPRERATGESSPCRLADCRNPARRKGDRTSLDLKQRDSSSNNADLNWQHKPENRPDKTDERHASKRGADLFGVELHLALSLWEKLNVVRSVDLLANYSDLISNGELKRNLKYTHCRESGRLKLIWWLSNSNETVSGPNIWCNFKNFLKNIFFTYTDKLDACERGHLLEHYLLSSVLLIIYIFQQINPCT